MTITIDQLTEEQGNAFHYELYMFSLMAAESYYARDQYDRDTELFSFDDEVFDQIIYNGIFCFFVFRAWKPDVLSD